MQRLVVVGASTAAIAGGVLPLTSGTAFAATGDNATAATISPASASSTVGNCTAYSVSATPAGAKFDVQLSETVTAAGNTNSGGATVSFCDVSGFSGASNPSSTATAGNTVTSGTAGTSVADAQFTADANGNVTFGVVSNTPGTVNIQAYDDINGNSVYEPGIDTPLSSATDAVSANTTTQGTGSIVCQPATQNDQVGQTAVFNCNVTTDAGNAANSTTRVNDVVTSGPDTGQQNTCTYDTTAATAGTNGQFRCIVKNGGTAGADNVVFYVDSNNNGARETATEASTTATANFVAANGTAPANSTVTITCSPNATNAAGDACQDPTSDSTATFTASVQTGSGNPASGVTVTFAISPANNRNGAAYTYSPKTCTTGADGTCSTTVTNPSPTEGDSVTVTASVQDANANTIDSTNSATKTWHNPAPAEARFVSLSPKTSTQTSGGSQALVATVTDRFGNPVADACVGFTISGGSAQFANANAIGCSPARPGQNENSYPTSFATGCNTDSNGQCTVVVTTASGQSGTSTITAELATGNYSSGGEFYFYNQTAGQYQYTPECALAANTTYGSHGTYQYNQYLGSAQNLAAAQSTGPGGLASTQPGVAAGSCTDTATVTFNAPSSVNKVTVHGQNGTVGQTETVAALVQNSDGSNAAGVTVAFTVSGANAASGTAITNQNGIATFSYVPSAAGTDTITATASNGTQGSTQVTIASKPAPQKIAIKPGLTLRSPRRGVITLTTFTKAGDAGARVTFYYTYKGVTHQLHGRLHSNGRYGTHVSGLQPHSKVVAHAVIAAHGNYKRGVSPTKYIFVHAHR